MKTPLLIILFSSLLFSCSPFQEKNDSSSDIQAIEAEEIIPETQEQEEEEIVKTQINFGDYELIIHEYEAYGNQNSYPKDSATLEEEMGYILENVAVEIIPKSESDSFSILIARENKLMVYLGEKDTRELSKWNTISGFEPLEDSSKLFFRIGKTEPTNLNKELHSDKNELLEAITEMNVPSVFENYIESTDSISDLGIVPFISRTFLKIMRVSSGQKEVKIVVVNSSWGC